MYLGIDLGTSGLKSIVIDDTLKVVHEDTKTYDFITLENGATEQDPNLWINALRQTIKTIDKNIKSKIKAISFSGQMHGSVFLDKNNNVLRNAILWNDQRTDNETKELNKLFPLKNALSKIGNIFLTGFTAPKVLWFANHEKSLFKKLYKVLLPKDYLVWYLCCKYATDYADASGTAYFNVKTKKWDEEILNAIKINSSHLPDVFPSNSTVGVISEKLSRELGLNKDIKIIIGGGDQSIGAIGVKAVSEGVISCSFGTSGVVYAPSQTLKIDSKGRLHSFASATNEYLVMGVALSTGASVNWMMNNLFHSQDYDYYLGKKTNDRKITNIIFKPYLNGERTPHFNSEIRGSIHNLDLSHNDLDIAKAVLEGIIFSLKDSLEIIKENKIKIDQIIAHGGLTKNIYFNQMIANIFNNEIKVPTNVNGAAYGAAIVAKSGFENIPIKEIVKNIKNDYKVYKPEATKTKIYLEKYEIYKAN